MPTPAEIVEEAERLRDFFEQRWNLPWYSDRASAPIWRHRFLHLLAHLPEGHFEETMELLCRHESFALKGIALHLVRMRDCSRFSRRAQELLRGSRSIHVRALAAAALGQFADEAAVDALLEVKDGEHAEVKRAVVDAMHRLRDPRGIPLLARWVGRAGEDDELRRKACDALGAIGDDAAMPVLSRVLADDTAVDDVRGDAALAIGRIGGDEARELLLRGLGSDRPWVVARCAQGLSYLGDPALGGAIRPLLDAQQPWMVRSLAIEALARLDGADALPDLLPLLQDPEARIRGDTCVALGLVGTAAVREPLQRMLADRELAVQVQALDAFTRVTGADFGFRIEDHQGALDPKALRQALAGAAAWKAAD